MSKSVPEFNNEDEEGDFWGEHNSSEYLNWKRAKRVLFPNLKPSTRSISLRLPDYLTEGLNCYCSPNAA